MIIDLWISLSGCTSTKSIRHIIFGASVDTASTQTVHMTLPRYGSSVLTCFTNVQMFACGDEVFRIYRLILLGLK